MAECENDTTQYPSQLEGLFARSQAKYFYFSLFGCPSLNSHEDRNDRGSTLK